MEFLKSIKNAFIEEDESMLEKQPDLSATMKTTRNVAKSTYQRNATTSSTPTTAASSSKIKETLIAELQKKLVGSSYLQFQKINSTMKSKISDVSTRYVAAGASLEVQNITKQSILDSAATAISFLNDEAVTFQQEIAGSLQILEQEFQSKTQAIVDSLNDKQNQIKTLSEEISNLQKEKSQLEIDVAANKTKLEITKLEFDGSVNSLIQEVNSEIGDITKYMGA